MITGVLVLAAGRATRFGTDKRLASLPDGRCVIDTTLANIRDSGLPFLVCLGESDDALIHHLDEQKIPRLRCSRASEGMGATLAEGIRHLSDWEGVLVALADMPWIAPSTYRVVAEQLVASNIVVPVHDGRRGHPVGFGCEFYPELAALHGDSGARRLLDTHTVRVTEAPVADAAIHWDIDVPTDLQQAP